MSLLGLMNTLVEPTRASGVRWHGHVLRRDNGDVLRRALGFEVAERRGRGTLDGLTRASGVRWYGHVVEKG